MADRATRAPGTSTMGVLPVANLRRSTGAAATAPADVPRAQLAAEAPQVRPTCAAVQLYDPTFQSDADAVSSATPDGATPAATQDGLPGDGVARATRHSQRITRRPRRFLQLPPDAVGRKRSTVSLAALADTADVDDDQGDARTSAGIRQAPGAYASAAAAQHRHTPGAATGSGAAVASGDAAAADGGGREPSGLPARPAPGRGRTAGAAQDEEAGGEAGGTTQGGAAGVAVKRTADACAAEVPDFATCLADDAVCLRTLVASSGGLPAYLSMMLLLDRRTDVHVCCRRTVDA